MKTKVIIFSVATVLILSVGFKLRSNKLTVEEKVYRPDQNKRVLVQAAVAQKKSLAKTFSYTGTFAPNREVMIVPQVHGEVKGIFFDEGDVVPQGKLLVQIDDDLLQSQLIAADASYQTAKRNLERYENASSGGGVSKIQLDNYLLSFKNAESTLRQIEKQIALSRITAPFAGTITLRDAEIGSVVGGSPIARVTDMSRLKLEISVPEKEITMFNEGDEIKIVTDIEPGKELIGKIDYVADRADDSHNYDITILLNNRSQANALKAGMYGTALISGALDKESLLIPRTALLGSAKNPQVFVIEEGKAVLKTIQTGKSNDESVQVIDGLSEGERVVITGHINLTNGTNVEIVN
jgi:RND family efflux transporter MFP subunit